jgi:hypothetical protein
MDGFFAAFPDAAYTLDDMFFAGDRGVWRGRWQATQQSEWQGIAGFWPAPSTFELSERTWQARESVLSGRKSSYPL